MSKEKELWITNISKVGIHIRDLGVTLQPNQSINLLRPGNRFTIEQINKSLSEGSLFQRRDKLIPRNIEPENPKIAPGKYVSQNPVEFRNNIWSKITIKEESYEELEISENEFVDSLTNTDSED